MPRLLLIGGDASAECACLRVCFTVRARARARACVHAAPVHSDAAGLGLGPQLQIARGGRERSYVSQGTAAGMEDMEGSAGREGRGEIAGR